MNLYQEILADILSREEICIEFPNLTNHASELVEMKSYQTLKLSLIHISEPTRH